MSLRSLSPKSPPFLNGYRKDRLTECLLAFSKETLQDAPERFKALFDSPPGKQVTPSLRDDMLKATAPLMDFAILLCGDINRANDLVQEAMAWAITNIATFQPRTNMSAWLFTILRNNSRSEDRKQIRRMEDTNGHYHSTVKPNQEQDGKLALEDFTAALKNISPDQREALLLVGVFGFPYESAAEICGCAVGTIKSRVNRARTHLAQILRIDNASQIVSGEPTTAAIGS
jgi:RNA polymerase sigma-70 factor (ECF subfamily)